MSKGAETRREILSEALQLTSESGLDALSIGGLAQAVGMSKSGLYAHFGSKEDLQMRVLDEAANLFVQRVVTPALRQPRGEPRLRGLFEGWIDWETEFLRGGCPFIAAAAEYDDRPGPVRDRLVAYLSDLRDTVQQAARIARAEGHFDPNLDVAQFAYEFNALLMGYHHYARLLRSERAAIHARHGFEQLLQRSRPH